MKHAFFTLSLLLLAYSSTGCKQEAYGKAYGDYEANEFRALQLDNIQSKIYSAFVQSQISKSAERLLGLKDELAKLAAQHANPLIRYWQGYLHYYLAIYYLTVNDNAAAESTAGQGIDILESIERKNSEDYALLALVQSFSIQFVTGMAAGALSGKVKSNVGKAMKLDDQNLRAYYVAASNDYYTPEKYGGGKNVETYLKRAIELPEQKVSNNTLPSWGKEEAYEMLIKFYIKNEDWANAKKYFQEVAAKYPQSYAIGKLATQLVGK